MIDRLREAWQGAMELYARTSVRLSGGPVTSVIHGREDLQLVVAHLLMSSPDGELQVHQDVAPLRGAEPVALVVVDPGPGLVEERLPWARVTRAAAADLAAEIRVVEGPDDRAAVEADIRSLHAIRKEKLAREVALCVLDSTHAPDRGFYEALEASQAVPILRAFGEDMLAT